MWGSRSTSHAAQQRCAKHGCMQAYIMLGACMHCCLPMLQEWFSACKAHQHFSCALHKLHIMGSSMRSRSQQVPHTLSMVSQQSELHKRVARS